MIKKEKNNQIKTIIKFNLIKIKAMKVKSKFVIFALIN